MFNRPHVVSLGIAGLLLLTGSLSAQSIEGTYKAEGAGPGGTGPYSGTVQIKPGTTAMEMSWNLGSGSTDKGIGVIVGDVLAAAYAGDKPFGLVLYSVQGGKLIGAWAQSPSMQIGEEILSGPEGLNGTYTIESGKNNKGETYSGTVTIKKTGETYSLKWVLPNETYVGTGLLLGEVLVVAWSASPEFGVVAYLIEGDKLKGKWAAGGTDALGTESLTKQK